MRYWMDDAETIQRWKNGFGYVAVCLLWAVVMVLASGILSK